MSEGVGVFVGISSPDYADLAKTHSEISAYSATGGFVSNLGLANVNCAECCIVPVFCSMMM